MSLSRSIISIRPNFATILVACAWFSPCVTSCQIIPPGGGQPAGWQIKLQPEGTSTASRRLVGPVTPELSGVYSSLNWSLLIPGTWFDVGNNASFGFTFQCGLFDEDNLFTNYALDVKNQGSVGVVAKWNPGSDFNPSPTRVYYRISSNADAMWIGEFADNGLGSELVDYIIGIRRTGSRTFKKDVDPADSETTLNSFNLLSQSSQESLLGRPSAALGFNVSILSPAFISSDIESAFYKDANGEKKPSLRDPDLTLIVHCAVEWQYGYDRWAALTKITGNQSSYNQAQFIWNHTVQTDGPYTDDFMFSTYPTTPWGMYGIAFPTRDSMNLDSSTTITVNVHDFENGGNVVMDNTYKIHWHYPYENWVQTQEAEDDHDIVRPIECDPANIPNNEGAVATMTKPSALWGISKYALALFGSQLPDPRAKLLVKLFEIGVDEMTPSPTHRYPQFDPCWESSWSRWVHDDGIGYGFPPPTPSGMTLDDWQSQFYMHAKFIVGTRFYYVRADKYSEHGFEGTSDFVVKRVFSDLAAGDYYFYDTSGGNPNFPPVGGA